MYTIVPFRGRRALSVPRQLNSLFDDRFFRSFFDMSDMMGSSGLSCGFRVDIKDQKDSYVLEAELPGLTEDQINLSVDENTLKISAETKASGEENDSEYYYRERRYGHCERSFNLEGIKQDGIQAEYKNGILYVTLPKQMPEPKKAERRIAISTPPEEEK